MPFFGTGGSKSDATEGEGLPWQSLTSTILQGQDKYAVGKMENLNLGYNFADWCGDYNQLVPFVHQLTDGQLVLGVVNTHAKTIKTVTWGDDSGTKIATIYGTYDVIPPAQIIQDESSTKDDAKPPVVTKQATYLGSTVNSFVIWPVAGLFVMTAGLSLGQSVASATADYVAVPGLADAFQWMLGAERYRTIIDSTINLATGATLSRLFLPTTKIVASVASVGVRLAENVTYMAVRVVDKNTATWSKQQLDLMAASEASQHHFATSSTLAATQWTYEQAMEASKNFRIGALHPDTVVSWRYLAYSCVFCTMYRNYQALEQVQLHGCQTGFWHRGSAAEHALQIEMLRSRFPAGNNMLDSSVAAAITGGSPENVQLTTLLVAALPADGAAKACAQIFGVTQWDKEWTRGPSSASAPGDAFIQSKSEPNLSTRQLQVLPPAPVLSSSAAREISMYLFNFPVPLQARRITFNANGDTQQYTNSQLLKALTRPLRDPGDEIPLHICHRAYVSALAAVFEPREVDITVPSNAKPYPNSCDRTEMARIFQDMATIAVNPTTTEGPGRVILYTGVTGIADAQFSADKIRFQRAMYAATGHSVTFRLE